MGILHLKKFLVLPDVEITGIIDSDLRHCERVATQFGVKPYRALAELLFDTDAAIVATPTASHYSVVRLAFEAGVHVLVEKPISTNLEQAAELVKLASLNKVIFQVGFLERFRLRKLIAALPFARPQWIEAQRFADTPGREQAHIDVVMDLMIHDIDLVLSLVGEMPSVISAWGLSMNSPLTDIAAARLEFPSGATANLSANRVYDSKIRKLRFFSSEGYVCVDMLANEAKFGVRDNHGNILKQAFRKEIDALAEQASEFVHCVLTKGNSVVSGSDGLASLRVASKIQEKIGNGLCGGVQRGMSDGAHV
ncbi:MAG: Gfo/Idh/MocA family oxidoreductase [Deltaproteobacteria bacterium]|nr:Gfo/Idh/MocA family oxidoreductase [Deltaproteobacteria bacterium]